MKKTWYIQSPKNALFQMGHTVYSVTFENVRMKCYHQILEAAQSFLGKIQINDKLNTNCLKKVRAFEICVKWPLH